MKNAGCLGLPGVRKPQRDKQTNLPLSRYTRPRWWPWCSLAGRISLAWRWGLLPSKGPALGNCEAASLLLCARTPHTAGRNRIDEHESEEVQEEMEPAVSTVTTCTQPYRVPWLWLTPGDTLSPCKVGLLHICSGVNSSCSSRLILTAPSMPCFYCTSLPPPGTLTPGVVPVFCMCW